MMFPILVALVAVQPSCNSVTFLINGPHTYRYQEPTTGEEFTCSRCSPGSHMLKHCTATTPTTCQKCPQNHYTQFWNYLPKCLYCSTFCGENQRVKEDCTETHNRVCECEEGFYSDNDFCVRHTECPLGYGVKRTGTTETDTECEKCPNGSFSSNLSSITRCANHTDCPFQGLAVFRGTCWHDNICVSSCEELKTGDGLLFIKTFLPDFFQFHKIRISRLRRLVGKLTNGVEEEQTHNRRLLLDKLRDWVRDATVGELGSLPEVLRKITGTQAGRLERKMRELRDATNCQVAQVISPPPYCDADDSTEWSI